MIIDATDRILGRLAVFAAKQALLGEEITIINSEKAVVSGSKKDVFAKYNAKYKRGIPLQGPYVSRLPESLVRRTIRGMLPYKQEKGRSAFERIRCYRGVPESLKDKAPDKVKIADVSKLPISKYVTMYAISKELGAKI